MKVKVCCIASIEEAELAISFGADALGLVGPMPSGPGIISLAKISAIVNAIPANINTFLLTSETNSDKIIAQHKLVKTSTIQIVDEIQQGSLSVLKAALPDVNLVQVVHVLDESSIDLALQKSAHADMLLLDSGNPNLKVKQLGGTGKVHNWEISKKIIEQSPVPVFLAGGLNADNVSKAIQEVNPFGVDICSGLRSNGKLDREKLIAFFDKVHA